MSKIQDCVIKNRWDILKEFTEARIGLGRVGVNLPTNELLAFQLAHAQAQDAVHLPLDVDSLSQELNNMPIDLKLLNMQVNETGLIQDGCTPILLHSKAQNRSVYLQRPDLGRRLDEHSIKLLENFKSEDITYDLAIVIVDGLSSFAIKENAVKYIKKLTLSLANEQDSWKIAPFAIVQQGRVAIGDEVASLLNAKAVLVLIGERPGLSSPDSLGLYLTYNPKIGLTDAYRNCISNVRLDGLSYDEAVNKSMYLLKESRRLQLSGVNLKERTQDNIIENSFDEQKNFLIK
ncbi:ethanolamine ammonia-lyase [Malaciobacter molluscorum LMG 25693]|uniref:Ethanolamine ammonia-lyase small subunit n=1 Tax=Malaciobacter molluscorum LMG 25693 TaxID=870501 RepID=A0A2G1DIQ2_9BACT|nr:ethanolamine ammonia-lyase subunit EutC [Malaciobacter molluscorum]AXX91885.1 ethanolamine ammonia-lyase, beta subunit [Malaciobacter molluscorum LMG 25693]PHO18294.1 ethanolamine ammonia-lyase [Malaciobacter molluscorum LMG 25693]RXJ94177.1 ethanolamine ammonia-lyase [Malaciobacter molluscorum]